MGLLSSNKSTTQNIKRDSTVTVGGNTTGPLVTGNESSNITINSVDAEVINSALDYSKFNLSTATKAITEGSKNALDAVSEGFSTALDASKSSDERLSGKVFTSVNIGLALAGLAIAVYVFKKS